MPTAADHPLLRVGVSACLIGQRVRHDGGHKLDPYVADVLGHHVELVAICPEVGIGLPVPRETLRLVSIRGATRLIAESGADLTARMERFSRARLRELRALDLSGYVLKSGSPSCGMEGVRLYDGQGRFRVGGAGLFAAALMRAFPLLPIEDERRLREPLRREAFVERLLAYRRVRDLA